MAEDGSSCDNKAEEDEKTDEDGVIKETPSSEEGCSTADEDPEAERKASEELLSEEEKERRRELSLDHKNKGNSAFGEGNFYEAVKLYSEALDVCPLVYSSERAMYLSNRAASHMKLSDWESGIKDCTAAIELGPPNDKPLERRAHSYAMSEDTLEKAIEDYQSLVDKYPHKRVYQEKIEMLKQQVNERNEKMKQDMIEKLKSLGNMCLRPFGLSTDNFELQKQPGGGYSVNMKK